MGFWTGSRSGRAVGDDRGVDHLAPSWLAVWGWSEHSGELLEAARMHGVVGAGPFEAEAGVRDLPILTERWGSG